jgi:hypothetical protein
VRRRIYAAVWVIGRYVFPSRWRRSTWSWDPQVYEIAVYLGIAPQPKATRAPLMIGE